VEPESEWSPDWSGLRHFGWSWSGARSPTRGPGAERWSTFFGLLRRSVEHLGASSERLWSTFRTFSGLLPSSAEHSGAISRSGPEALFKPNQIFLFIKKRKKCRISSLSKLFEEDEKHALWSAPHSCSTPLHSRYHRKRAPERSRVISCSAPEQSAEPKTCASALGTQCFGFAPS